MGLSIRYTMRLPANTSPVKITRTLEEVRQHALTLPVTSVGPVRHTKGPDEFGRSLDLHRGLSMNQRPSSTYVFLVDVRPGSESAEFGVSSFPSYTWRQPEDPDEIYIPHYDKDDPVFVAFRRKWRLKVAPADLDVGWIKAGTPSRFFNYNGRLLAEMAIRARHYTQVGRPILRIFGSYRQTMVLRVRKQDYDRLVVSEEFASDLRRLCIGEEEKTFPADRWVRGDCCKTQYASNPEEGGTENFVIAHLAVLAILEKARQVGFEVTVRDDSDFWEHRDIQKLLAECDHYNAFIAGCHAAMKGVYGDGVKSPIEGRADYQELVQKSKEIEQINKLLALLAPAT